MVKQIIKIKAMRKDWFTCKKCHKKLLLFNDIANSTGIFIKCKKCGYENEIKIKDGKVI